MSYHPIYVVLAFMALMLTFALVSSGFDPIQTVSLSIPFLVLAAQLSLILLVLAILFKGRYGFLDSALSAIIRDGRLMAFLISLTAMVGSLSYQFIIQLAPCELCWFQRIFMYPLPFIIGVSLVTRRKDVFQYAIPLCSVGALIASYQYLIQIASQASFVCLTAADAPCNIIQTAFLGYMTIPLMSLTAFIGIAILLFLDRR